MWIYAIVLNFEDLFIFEFLFKIQLPYERFHFKLLPANTLMISDDFSIQPVTVWTWIIYLTTPSLSFLISKMGLSAVLTSEVKD